MTLPTGQISLSQVNTELGLSATAQIDMNMTSLRTLFGVSSGQISMSNGQGKSAVALPVITKQTTVTYSGGTSTTYPDTISWVYNDAPITLSVSATGGTLTYAWQSNSSNSSTGWVTSAYGTPWTMPVTTSGIYGQISPYWRCAISNAAGTVYSGVMYLDVEAP